MAAGANVKAVQRMLGHASAAMTLDVYAGLFGDDLDAVAERLHQAVSGRVADQVRTIGTLETVTPLPAQGTAGALTCGYGWSRLSESNRRPTHYECVALAD